MYRIFDASQGVGDISFWRITFKDTAQGVWDQADLRPNMFGVSLFKVYPPSFSVGEALGSMRGGFSAPAD